MTERCPCSKSRSTEDAESVHIAWFDVTSEQVSRELQLAGALEAAATRLLRGQGWEEGTTVAVLAATKPTEEFNEDAVAIRREFMEDAWQSKFRQTARHPPPRGDDENANGRSGTARDSRAANW